MDMAVSEKLIHTVVITPQGRLDAFTAPELRERLEQYLAEGHTKFVLDLSQISFLDSAGMAVMVNVYKRTRQLGGDVKLVWPQAEAARRILHLTRFDRVFTMADSAEAALKGF